MFQSFLACLLLESTKIPSEAAAVLGSAEYCKAALVM